MKNNDIIGNCICTSCGFSMPAPQGADCGLMNCPKCGSPMRNAGTGFTPREIK